MGLLATQAAEEIIQLFGWYLPASGLKRLELLRLRTGFQSYIGIHHYCLVQPRGAPALLIAVQVLEKELSIAFGGEVELGH